MMNKRDKLAIISAVVVLLIAVSNYFDYESTKYSQLSQSSSDYINFAVSFYQTSHLFCKPDYTCSFSNISFPEFQSQELKKFQDQVDWTSEKALKYNSLSNIFILLAVIVNFYLIYSIYKK